MINIEFAFRVPVSRRFIPVSEFSELHFTVTDIPGSDRVSIVIHHVGFSKAVGGSTTFWAGDGHTYLFDLTAHMNLVIAEADVRIRTGDTLLTREVLWPN